MVLGVWLYVLTERLLELILMKWDSQHVNGQRNRQKVHLSLTFQIPSVSRMLLETDNWKDWDSSGMEQINILQLSPAHPYRLHWSFYCMSQPPNTHSLLLGSFELNIPSRCKFPGGEAQDSSVHFLDLQLAHFRKQVSIWSYSTSICVYQFFFNFVKRRGLIQIYVAEEWGRQ